MHAGIFWGFVLLTIGHRQHRHRRARPGGHRRGPLDGALWAAVSAMQNVVAVIVLVSIPWAFERRLISRPRAPDVQPRRADHPGDDRRGRRDRAARPGRPSSPATATSPGAFVATSWPVPLRRRVGPSRRSRRVFVVLWWGHIALVAAFLVYLPFSKHLHIVDGFPNICYRKLAPRGELPAMDLEAEDATFGLKSLQDLGWKDLLDGFTCTECGRCQEACPAELHGQAAQPQGDSSWASATCRSRPSTASTSSRTARSSARPTGSTTACRRPALGKPIVDDAIPYDAVWDCVTCGACVEACPVLIEHVDKIVGLRRNLVLEEIALPAGADRRVPEHGAGRATRGASRARPGSTGRAACRSRSRRWPTWPRPAGWTSSRSSTGSAARPRSTSATGAWPGRSRRASTRPACAFAVLGQEESCTGDPARRMGNDYVYQMLATGNVETLNRYGMGERTIVTACPHCFNTIGNEYGQLGGSVPDRPPLGQYLSELLASGRLRTWSEDGSTAAGR